MEDFFVSQTQTTTAASSLPFIYLVDPNQTFRTIQQMSSFLQGPGVGGFR
jgi:hypothetical protein